MDSTTQLPSPKSILDTKRTKPIQDGHNKAPCIVSSGFGKLPNEVVFRILDQFETRKSLLPLATVDKRMNALMMSCVEKRQKEALAATATMDSVLRRFRAVAPDPQLDPIIPEKDRWILENFGRAVERLDLTRKLANSGLRYREQSGIDAVNLVLSSFANLESLNLSGNFLSNLEELNFNSNKKLRFLDLTGNHATSNFFRQATDAKFLDLHSFICNDVSLESEDSIVFNDFLKSQPNLLHLDIGISFRLSSSLNLDAFIETGHPELRSLKVRYKLEGDCLNNFSFERFPNLQQVEVSWTPSRTVTDDLGSHHGRNFLARLFGWSPHSLDFHP